MKIYSRKEYPVWNQIPRYLGKDVWVLCGKYNDNSSFICYEFVKFLDVVSVYGRDMYLVCTMPDYFLADDGDPLELSEAEYQRVFTPHKVPMDMYDIAHPFSPEIYSGQEVSTLLQEAHE